jgi:hypothetical protein
MKPTANSAGYPQVSLSKDRKPSKHLVHRLSLAAFVGPRPGPPRLNPANHIDGDKENNCIENLEWSTPGVNNIHAIHNGLRDYALNLELAEEIRQRYAVGDVTYRDLAMSYGVTFGTIGAVVRLERWIPPATDS